MNECIGCGYCCIKAPCMLAMHKYDNKITECPELYWDGTRYKCKLANKHKDGLAIGAGCCCSMNSWRREPLIERR